jgi:outer membrane protein OmpA-like peptidoglycan-associated protein
LAKENKKQLTSQKSPTSQSVKIEAIEVSNDKTELDRPKARKNVEIEELGNTIQLGTKAILRNIYFDFGTSNLTSESEFNLNRLYQTLIANPEMKIEIGGHTDNIGSAQSNLRISQSRANAVKIWLLKKGIAEQRLVAKGYGESQPLASNDDEINGRELNRRIEIIVFK